MIFQLIIFPIIYKFYSFNKIDKNSVVFAHCHGTKLPEQMILLSQAIKKDKNYKCYYYLEDYQNLSNFKVLLKSMQFLKIYAKSEFVIISDNFLPVSSCKKRKETKVIQLWHGCGAYKKFGYNSTDDIPKYYKGNVFKNYDLVCVSGEKCVKIFESAMKQKEGVVKAIGVPKTDSYFDQDYANYCKNKFYSNYPTAAGKKIVLWCPTFRGKALSPSKIDTEPMKKLGEMLGENYLVISKFHPHTKNIPEKVFTAKSMTSTELMFCSDIMITDYSSIVFEWMIFHKPLVFFMPDKDAYNHDRGLYLSLDQLPAPVTENVEELYEKIISQDDYRMKREKFKKDYMGACDGKSTEKVFDYIKGFKENA